MTYSGLTVVSYGGYLNGESFQQDGILTFNGYQYHYSEIYCRQLY